jgi:FkbM family methyltransferase
MNKKKFLKALLRSRDAAFAADFAGGAKHPGIGVLSWHGMRFHYRQGTSDSFVAYECFLHGKRNAYESPLLPKAVQVSTIVDIGANVGASVLFWKDKYPDAKIFAFEPILSNFEVLNRNCSELPDVAVYNEGLGDRDEVLSFIHSPGTGNEGGWSVFQRGASGTEEKIELQIRRSGERLTTLGIDKIDILKVDTEGAESKIIHGLGSELLGHTRMIVGELHGENDFELLAYLESQGFMIGARKKATSKLFNFEALNSRLL